MKILYGIQMTGNGHLTRSSIIIEELIKRNIKVDILVSGDNSSITIPFDVKFKFRGLSFYYDKNGSISWLKTIFKSNIFRLIKDCKLDLKEYDMIISDFEPISAWCAKIKGLKSIGIGNQYSFLSKNIKRPKNKNLLAEKFIGIFAPCSKVIAIAYHKYDDFIYLPIIRNSIINGETKNEDFYLVYLPSISLDKIIKVSPNDKKWKIYSDYKSDDNNKIENITVSKPDKINFENDLLRCKGIITACGFSTTSEALILKKKMWSIPIDGQYEQLCNSMSLKDMGVFTEEFNRENISIWLNEYNNVDYVWINPINEIIEEIIKYGKD
jgi:uncharacterized protein (TIGR00661 family)